MAAQVLSGKGNVSYTNSTGQNVRIVLNYVAPPGDGGATLTFQGVTVTIEQSYAVGKFLAWSIGSGSGERGGPRSSHPCPTEIAISNGETFSITYGGTSSNGAYNIIIIPEAG